MTQRKWLMQAFQTDSKEPQAPKDQPKIDGIQDILTIPDRYRNARIREVWDDLEVLIEVLDDEKLSDNDRNRILRVLKAMVMK